LQENRVPVTAADKPRSAPTRTVSAVLAAWILSIGFDLFLHAGVLSEMYVRESAFLLAPELAFRRIPAGYATFFLLTAGLWWVFQRLDVRGWLDGLRMGAAIGFFVWGSLVVGLWSISKAPIDLLLGWWLGQGFELGLAGTVLGSVRAGASLGRIWIKVVIAVVVLFAVVVTLQTLGVAASVRAP
jgi:hypothetical protein